VSGPSNVINREVVEILITIIEGDFKAPFLVNVSVEKGRERLIVLTLLDTGYRLSAIIDY
jgi:hypothetical protein